MMALSGASPDISVFVLELDVIAVPVAEDASLGSLVFQVEETSGYLTSLPQIAIDHHGRGYRWVHYVAGDLAER